MTVPGHNSGFGQALSISQWVFTSISIFVVLLRLISSQMKHGFKTGEIVTLSALAIEVAFTAVCTVGIGYGVGANWSELSPYYQMEATKWGVISNSLAVWTFSVPKVALVFLLHSLLCPGPLTSAALYGGTCILMCFSLVLSVMFYEQCDPVNSQWDRSVQGTCWDPHVLSDIAIFTGSFSAFLDFVLAAYPAWVVFHLHMNLWRRVSLAGILSLGLVAAVITAFKCKKLGALLSNPNPSYETAALLLWTNIESNVVIWGASIPTIFPVINWVRVKVGLDTEDEYDDSDRAINDAYDKRMSGYLNYGGSRKTTTRNTLIVPNHGPPQEHADPGLDNLELLERDSNQHKSHARIRNVERGDGNDSSNECEGDGVTSSDLIVQQRVDISVTESVRQDIRGDNESEMQVKHLH